VIAPLRGVYNILTTPFSPDGALDEASLRRLTDAVIAAGVDGLTVLGVAGEAQKLTDAERQRVLAVVVEAVDGRLPVVVGASRDGTDASIAAGRDAAAAGAAALMIAPPTFAQPGAALTEHYRRVAEAVRLPIVLQDYPPANGVTLGPGDMAALVHAVPAITTIKLEDPPTPRRVGQTLALLDGSATIMGGLGGVYLLDELRRGASGTMTGFSYPEILVAICRAEAAGDRRLATDLFYRSLPLLVFEGQPRIGLAIRKAILHRRGLIDHATVRQPGPRLDDGTLADLDETLAVLAANHGFDLIATMPSAPRP
jgi:4-hydroxy-tetrahydrodipicolinate synthase